MHKTTIPSLSGQLLVAVPGMADGNFDRSVTLVCQHDQNGAMGLVMNRAADFGFDKVLDQLGLESTRDDAAKVAVLTGGPVQPERGFVLHRSGDGEWDASHTVNDAWTVTTSHDILAAMAAGRGPSNALLLLGYAGWGAGQLEQELADNAWLTVPATDGILFHTQVEQRWQGATRLMGFDSHQLSQHVGHA